MMTRTMVGALMGVMMMGLSASALAGGSECSGAGGPGTGGPGAGGPGAGGMGHEGRGAGEYRGMDEAGGRFKEVRGKFLREKAGLSDVSAAKAEKVLDQFQPQRKAAQDARKEKAQAMRKLVEANGDDQKAYQRALEDIQEAHRVLQDLHEQEMGALSKVLTPKEHARTMVALQDMRKQAKHRYQEMQGGRGGPGGGKRGGPGGHDGGMDDDDRDGGL